ncbi:hypothetical protein SK128_025910 [Halocaridina rubra]|uniref:CUB domain-containing protein n=1 Tax=Halocaridina rubra TaxID=373956 RepID=A0AAN9FTR2_HALRR
MLNCLGICGTRRGYKQLVGTYHAASFRSENEVGSAGWSVSFTQRASSCHKNLILTESSPSGILNSPLYPKNYPKNSQCEWWLTAPPGRRIKLVFQILRLATNHYFPNSNWFKKRFLQKKCNRGYVIVSRIGSTEYTRGSTSFKLCGYRNNGYTITSKSNKMSLLFFGGRTRNKGMEVSYTII